jgi:hypothetical protein
VNPPEREADHSPPTNAEIQEHTNLHIHFPISLHGVVLNYIKHRKKCYAPFISFPVICSVAYLTMLLVIHKTVLHAKCAYNGQVNENETDRTCTTNERRNLVGNPEEKRLLGRPRSRWEDNIKMDIIKLGWDVDNTHLAQLFSQIV